MARSSRVSCTPTSRIGSRVKRSSVVIPNALSPVRQQIKLRDSTLQRMHQRVEELARGFAAYCDQFDDSNLFTGTSRYFHFKTLTLLRKHKSMAGVMQDEDFFESLYATLSFRRNRTPVGARNG